MCCRPLDYRTAKTGGAVNGGAFAPFILTVDRLSDTDEVLYTSKQVPPGQMIEEITLTRPLEAGQYNATLRITTASLQDGSAMNGANVETILDVQ